MSDPIPSQCQSAQPPQINWKERAEKAEAELAEMRRKYGFTYCAYCGKTYEIDAPESTNEISKHIASCEKHPMRYVEAELERTISTSNARFKEVYSELSKTREELERVASVLPSTYYSGLPINERVRFVVDHWRRLVPIAMEFDKQTDELERVKKQFGTCSVCGYVAWRDRDQNTEDCQYCALQKQNAALQTALRKHHTHASEECRVYFEQDGKPIDICTNLGEAYQESSLCEETLGALKDDAGKDCFTREQVMPLVTLLETAYNSCSRWQQLNLINDWGALDKALAHASAIGLLKNK